MNNIQILIVDDVSQNLQVLGAILSKEGYDTNFAINGEEAIEIVPKLNPDLILLDINMPDIDGFNVCEILKNNPKTKHIPIIFLTAKIETENIIKGFSLGAADYITKPFNIRELLARVQTHAELKKTKDIILAQNKELNEKNKLLKELIATKDKFISILAHDLKSPFNSLIGFSRLLLHNFEELNIEKAKSYIEIIYKASKNTYSFLENLLEWAKTQQEKVSLSQKNINLSILVNECIEFHQSSIVSKEIIIKDNVIKDIIIFADSEMIKTVIRNLIANAIKYSKKGGEIKIDSILNNKNIEISISDNGIGMDEKTKQSLFKIEETKSIPGTDGERGTGFGLLICKEIIEEHGCKIWAESAIGKGSVFKFTLPLMKLIDK